MRVTAPADRHSRCPNLPWAPVRLRRGIPSLNWLRVFEAAARTESLARAAETLNMSPSAVSQQIKALETHSGWSCSNAVRGRSN